MATQTIALNDIQARTERLRSRALFNEPKKIVERKIKIHRCFNQASGQEKPETCSCKDPATYSEALGMIARGEASWLKVWNPKTNARVEFQRAIVARISVHEIKAETKRLETYRRAESEIIKKLRNLIVKKFSSGNLPPVALDWSDAELRGYLGAPEQLRERFPEFGEKKLFQKILDIASEFWTNQTDTEAISPNAGCFLNGAPQGQGLLVTGGYGSKKLGQVSTHDFDFACDSENIKELGTLLRVKPEGYAPDSDEEDYAEKYNDAE